MTSESPPTPPTSTTRVCSPLEEPEARNTQQNIELTRQVLDDRGITAQSAVLISRPYQQRRAWATAAKVRPELEVICSSRPLPLDDYIASIGDVERVINMLVGDTQRITAHADRGFAALQHVPGAVEDAYRRLVDAGYTNRLV